MTDTSGVPHDLFEIELPAQPYPGLRPFEKSEWPIFFGRETITGEVIERLIGKQFLALHGDSGCGKSSLIRAGVMPRLERDHARGGATWRTTSMLPRNAPLRNLAMALAALEADPPDPARVTELRRILNYGSKAAAYLSLKLRRNEHDYICILVDQFEEIFQHVEQGGAREAQQFVDVLIGLQCARAPGLHVILTMRSEFLGRCAMFEGLAEAINETQFLLPRMDTQDLMRTIREPARLYSGEVERELAEAIIADAGRGQDQLPLMQHAIMLLQRRCVGPVGAADETPPWSLKLTDYRSSGGVARLLSEHADGVASNIETSAADPAAAAHLLQRLFKALTDVNADGYAIRRPQSIGELVAVTGAAQPELLRILEPLSADGVSFLRIFGRPPYGDTELVDISHEALIRIWDRLNEWTQEEANDGAIYHRLLGIVEQHRSDPSIILGLGEARDRELWWKRVVPTQAWANRYSRKFAHIAVADVWSFIELSLDAKAQAASLWRYEIEWLGRARENWEKMGRRPEALLASRALYDAEKLLERGQPISTEDHSYIKASREAEDAKRERERVERKLEREKKDRELTANSERGRGEAFDNRSRFIPITRFALADRLTAPNAWSVGRAADARRFFRYLDLFRQQQYSARLLELDALYEPFSPDSDLLLTRAFSADELRAMEARVVEQVSLLLESANYARLSTDDLASILTASNHYGLDLHVDFSAFEELLICYRGASVRTLTRRSMKTLYRKKEIDQPIFQRLFVLFKLKRFDVLVIEVMKQQRVDRKAAEKIVRRSLNRLPKGIQESNIYLKLYKNIPRTDLEMLLPNTEVRFRAFDKLRVGVAAVAGTGLAVFAAVGKLALLVSNPIGAAGAMLGLGGIALRQVVTSLNEKQRYMAVRAQNLHFHSIADNGGVFNMLAARAAEEDVKEEMLLYSVLAKENAKRSDLPSIDAAVEEYLFQTFGVTMECDLDDALSRLLMDGIVRETSDGWLETLPPREAASLLEQRWDTLLDNVPDHVSAEEAASIEKLRQAG